MDAREKISEEYLKSRDYTLLLEFPQFVRFLKETRESQELLMYRATHGETVSKEEVQDMVTSIRYFNLIIGKLTKVANQEPFLKEKLEAMGIDSGH